MKKLFNFVIFCIILSVSVSAVYEAAPILTDDAGAGGYCTGLLIQPNKNITLDYVIFHAGSAGYDSVNIYELDDQTSGLG